MKVVVAIDSFKGSLTSIEAGMAGKDRTSGRENFILDPDPG